MATKTKAKSKTATKPKAKPEPKVEAKVEAKSQNDKVESKPTPTKSKAPTKVKGKSPKANSKKAEQPQEIDETSLTFEAAMRFSVKPSALIQAIGYVKEGTPSKPQHPALANVSIRCVGETLQVTTSDLMLSLRATLTVENCMKSGGVLVPTNILADLVPAYKGNTLTLQGSIASASSEAIAKLDIVDEDGNIAEIRGMPEEEFPEVQSDAAISTIVGAKLFLTVLRSVHFASSSDDKKPILNGVYLQLADGNLTATASDGGQIATASVSIAGVGRKARKADFPKFSCILPNRLVGVLMKLLTSAEAKDEVLLGYNPNTRQVTVELANDLLTKQIICTTLDGEFPPVNDLLQQFTYPKKVEVPTGEFITRLSRLQAIADKNNSTIVIQLLPDELKLSCDFRHAKSQQSLPSICKSDPASIGLAIKFSVRYLTALFKALPTDTAQLMFGSSNSALKVVPVGNSLVPDTTVKAEYFVLPMYDDKEAIAPSVVPTPTPTPTSSPSAIETDEEENDGDDDEDLNEDLNEDLDVDTDDAEFEFDEDDEDEDDEDLDDDDEDEDDEDEDDD
jgi:DNA polymerase-3 subunit beta